MEEPTSEVTTGSPTKPAEAQRGESATGDAGVTPVAPKEDIGSPLKSIVPDAGSSKQVSCATMAISICRDVKYSNLAIR